MSYATANDTDFFADFLNFQRLAKFDPGVAKVEVFITISEVRPRSKYDELIANGLAEVATRNPKIRINSITFKSNVGRDFSSAASALKMMIERGTDEDYALFVNRSGFGPYCRDWFSKYLNLLIQTNSELVGSTINGVGHPNGKYPGLAPHIQTYCYFSKLKFLRPFSANFPAEQITDRIDLIDEGEIGLSRHVLERGGSIACLNSPKLVISTKDLEPLGLPMRDIKKRARNLPFLYKHSLSWNFFGRQKFQSWRKPLMHKLDLS